MTRYITKDDLEANILDTYTLHLRDHLMPSEEMLQEVGYNPVSLMTLCVMVLRNGYTVVGKSACADPAKFDPALGTKLAREDALRQVWPLMGYKLRDDLHKERPYGAA